MDGCQGTRGGNANVLFSPVRYGSHRTCQDRGAVSIVLHPYITSLEPSGSKEISCMMSVPSLPPKIRNVPSPFHRSWRHSTGWVVPRFHANLKRWPWLVVALAAGRVGWAREIGRPSTIRAPRTPSKLTTYPCLRVSDFPFVSDLAAAWMMESSLSFP